MNGVAALVLLLADTCLSQSCEDEGPIVRCNSISSHVKPGFHTLHFLFLSNVGEINSTVLHNDNLASITVLTINNAGVTGIANNAFSSFQNLSNLRLEGNKLSEINTNWFTNPAVLRELNLTGNRIEVVNESTFSFPKLTKLTLSKNWIKRVHPESFRSQSQLAELDLSENNLTWIPPQVFSSLRSLRSIKLDGNPWNCSCDHQDFVAYIKDLQNNSQLDNLPDVTCETPPALKGRQVWKVSVCPVSPAAASSTSTAEVDTTRPSQQTSKTETAFLLKPTEALSTISPHSGTLVTSLSGTDTSVHLRPTKMPETPHKPTNTSETPPKTPGPPDANIVCTLIAVIAVLCVLLFAACFLAVLHRRKRTNKAVMPGCPKEKKRKLEEGDRPRNDQCEEVSSRDLEVMRKKPVTGVRAKSANAVILTSPFGSSEKNKVIFQTWIKTQSESSEEPGGKQKVETEDEAAAAGRGRGVQMENQTSTDTVKEDEKREDDDDLYEKPECVYVNTDTVPYLSIGVNQNNPSPEEDPSADPSQRSQMGKAIGRISTWPPTAAQWQARCKMRDGEEEEGGEGITVWTQSEAVKLSDEEEKTRKKRKQPESSELCEQEDETENNHVNLRDSLILRDSATEEQLKRNPATERETKPEISPNLQLKSAENPTDKSGSKTEARPELKRAATGRQRAENRAAASKAPSGGTSPDDETLLSGNEYAFMDLLHEVSQNNGRRTRDRWKQTHVNKQRR